MVLTNKLKKLNTVYIRNLIFGVEDSLVSTVGILFGITTANSDKRAIVITGLVVVIVEAISMGAGAFLTEDEAQEIDGKIKHKDNPVISGLIMFGSYFTSGAIVLSPYLIFSPVNAKYISAVFATVCLFILGYLPTLSIKSGIRMAVIATIAVATGFIIGRIANVY